MLHSLSHRFIDTFCTFVNLFLESYVGAAMHWFIHLFDLLFKAERVDTEFHDDDEFTKTLEQLDKQEAKKV